LTDTIGEAIGETIGRTLLIGSAPRRHIPLPGTLNLRDVGGYPTRDGGSGRALENVESGPIDRR